MNIETGMMDIGRSLPLAWKWACIHDKLIAITNTGYRRTWSLVGLNLEIESLLVVCVCATAVVDKGREVIDFIQVKKSGGCRLTRFANIPQRTTAAAIGVIYQLHNDTIGIGKMKFRCSLSVSNPHTHGIFNAWCGYIWRLYLCKACRNKRFVLSNKIKIMDAVSQLGDRRHFALHDLSDRHKLIAVSYLKTGAPSKG